MATTVAELEAIITADTSGFDAGVAAASEKLNELGQSTGSAAEKMQAAGTLMTAAGAAFLAPIVGAVKGAADFEFAMDAVNASLGGMDTATMDLLEQQALDLGAASKFSATEVAGVMEQLAKSGISAEDLLDGATGAVLDLAAATGEGLVPSTKVAADMMNMFGLQGDQMTKVADVLTGSLNNSSTSIEGLARGMNYLGPVLNNQNRYLEMTEQGLDGAEQAFIDTAAAVSFFNKMGLPAADAGVSLARGIDFLSRPTDKAAKLINELGLEVFDLNGNFLPIPDLMDELNEKMSGMSDKARGAALSTIFGAEAADVMNQAIRLGGDPLREHTKLLEEDGIAARQAALRQDNLTSAVEMLGGALNGLAIEMGTPLLDPLKNVTEGITEFVDILAGAPEPIQRMVSQFGALTGGLLTFGGLAALGTGQVLKLGEQFKRASLSLPLFSAGLLGVGLAIGAGLLAYETNFGGFADFVDGKLADAGNAVETFGKTFDEVFSENKAVGLNDLAAAVGAFGTAIDAALGTNISQQTRKLAEGMQRFGDTFEDVGRIMRDAGFNNIAADIAAVGYAIDAALGTDVAPMFDQLARAAQVFGKSWELAREAGIDPFTSALLGARDAIGELAGVDLAVPMDNFGGALQSGIEGVVSFKDALLAGDWGAAWDGLTGGLDSVGLKLGEIDLGGKLQGVSDQLTSWFNDIGRSLFGGLDSMAGPGEREVQGAIPELADKLKAGFESLPQALSDLDLTSLMQPVQDKFDDWFGDIDETLFGEFDSMGGPGEREIQGAIPKLADSIKSGFESVLPDALKDIDFGGMVENVSDQFGTAFDDLGKTLFGGLDSMAGPGEREVQGLIPQLAESLKSGFEALPESLADIDLGASLGAVKDKFGEWFGDIGDSLNDLLLSGDFDSMGGPGERQVEGLVPKLAGDIADGFGKLPELIGEQLGNLANPMQAVGDWFDEQIHDEQSGFTQIKESAMDAGTQAMQYISEGFSDGMATGGVDSTGGPGERGEARGAVEDNVIKLMGGFKDDIVTQLADSSSIKPEVYQAAGALGTDLGHGLGTAIADGLFKEAGPGGPGGGAGKDLSLAAAQALGAQQQLTFGDAFTNFDKTFSESLVGAITPELAESKQNVIEKLGKEVDTFYDDLFEQDFWTGGKPGEGPAAMPGADLPERLATKMQEAMGIDPEKGLIGEIFDNLVQGVGAEGKGEKGKALSSLLGEDLGQTFVDALADPKFTKAIEKSLKDAPDEAFAAIGAGFLDQITEGMTTAMKATGDETERKGDPLGGGLGQKMVESITSGLTTALQAPMTDTFVPVASALLGGISDAMGVAMMAKGKGAASDAAADAGTSPIGGGMGQKMVESLATGLTDSITAADPALFVPATTALGTQLSAAMQSTQQQINSMGGPGERGEALQSGFGQQMVQGLATGLTDSITAAPPELFTPVANALGTQLGTAMSTAAQQTGVQPGLGGAPGQQAATGFGQQMVQGLATGLTDSITAAPPEMFIPVSNALGTQLGAAMSMAAQQTGVQPGLGGVPGQDAAGGTGLTMVQGLATGLTDSITAAPPETFTPVGQALGTQLGTALNTAMTEAQQVTPGLGGEQAAGGIGAQMTQQLATGLADSITSAPIETFTPVGVALGTKMTEALQTAVEGGAAGAEGAEGVGVQMGDAVGQMLISGVEQADFTPVGTSLSTKLGETLQTVAEGGGEGDISKQLGDSVGQMMQSGVDQADFAPVGEAVSSKLTEQMDSAIEEVSTAVSDSMQQVTDAVTQAVEGMGEAVSQATESVTSAVESMSEAIQGAVEEVTSAVEEMSGAVEEAASTMQAAAEEAAAAAEEIGSAAASAAAEVAAAMQEMAAAVQAAAGAITAAAGQIVAALNEIAGAAGAAAAAAGAVGGMAPSGGGTARSIETGQSVAEGMAAGMDTGTPAVAEASRSLATTAFDSLAEAVQMGSPARRFEPIGRAVSQGFMRGMLQEAKGRLKQAMGQMAGAVASAMGRVKSAMASAMGRIKGEGARAASGAGAAMGEAAGDGMAAQERHMERAARKLWKKALRELLNGKGEMRFLGESFAREFWEGMLDASGSLEFAQFVTEQIVAAAENAIAAVLGKIKGLATQLQIVGNTISSIESNIASLEGQLASIDAQIASAAAAAADRAAAAAAQARVDAAQAELDAQRAITAELERRFAMEFSAAHQAHIKAAQAGGVGPAQAEYEAKLAQAIATDAAIAESKIKETQLEQVLEMIREAIAAEAAARAAAREAQAAADLQAQRARIAAELAAEQAKLAEQKRIQEELEQAQHDAQVEYTQLVIAESTKRIDQLEREKKKASSPERKAEIKAEIELERQKLELANQLAAALERQANAQTPEELAEANAQIEYLTQALGALDEVDVGAMLQEIVGTLSETSASMSSAAESMGKAAKALSSTDVAAPMKETAAAVEEVGTAAGGAGEQMGSMEAKYKEVINKMSADTLAFQEKFKAMTAQTAGIAGQGGTAIGTALSEGITGRISAGAPALQKEMLSGVQKGVDDTAQAAGKGGSQIANDFGAAMRGELGVQLPKVHQDILDGMTKSVDDTAKVASKGGKEVADNYGSEALDKLKQGTPKFQTAMHKGVDDGVRKTQQIAAKGGRDIGDALGDGIQKGVRGRAQQIANDAAKTVRDAIQAAKNAAGANSPSRKMMEVGDDMGLGLIYGLRDRRGEAKDASAALVHIPRLSPTSDGGVTGRRAFNERTRPLNVHIEHLELPGVSDPEQFIAAMEDMARTAGVSSGRG